MAKQVFKSEITLKNGLQVEGQSRNFKVIVDEPTQMGGSNEGMTPVELLLNALGSCMSITIAAFSKPFHVDIKSLKVEVEGDLDTDGFMGKADVPVGYSEIRLNILMETDASEVRVKKLVEMAESRCPVSATLGVPIKFNLKIN